MGVLDSPETIKKIAKANLQKIVSKETKRKFSLARQGNHHSFESRLKIGCSTRGVTRSEETKQKISQARKGKLHQTETRTKISMSNMGKNLSSHSRFQTRNVFPNKFSFLERNIFQGVRRY